MDGHSAMTLDEPVWHTVKRDLLQVGSKLQVVLLPRENQDGVLKKLKDCEWGDGLGRLIGVGVVVVRWNESRIHLINYPPTPNQGICGARCSCASRSPCTSLD